MQLHISSQQGLPIYLQILRQIKVMVASGRLENGQQLPPVRKLAQQLLVNPNTVARAYRELETAGIVESRQGCGVFVATNESPLSRRERMKRLHEQLDALLVEAAQLGIDFDELGPLLELRHRRMISGKKGRPS